MTTSLARGSIADVSQRTNQSLAQAFMAASTIVLFDVSPSMDAVDTGTQTRFQRACQELVKLQGDNPGRIALITFSDQPRFVATGIATLTGSGTDLTAALRFVAASDGSVDFIVISDGVPNDTESALRAVAGWESTIHTIYIGPEGGIGEDFLKRLARQHRGKHMATAGALALASVAQLMLPSA